ncbi:MAG: hypothetical protein O3A02_00755 [bacterium]|nr:hypothetical protein [bacterium]
MVLLREVRWLRAVAENRAEGAAPGASVPRSSLPAVVMERAH